MTEPRKNPLFLIRSLYIGLLVIILPSSVLTATFQTQIQNSNSSKIAFIKNINVYVMNSDGSSLSQLSSVQPGPADHPTWSPDSKHIAFDTVVNNPPESAKINKDIFLLDIDNSKTVNLTTNIADDAFPVWSPKGDQIAFVSNRNKNWDIFLMDIDGKNQINLTQQNISDDGIHGLTWSPDGSKIAFVSDKDKGKNSITGNYEAENIYVVNVQDNNNTNNTEYHNLTAKIDLCPAGEFYLNPTWSSNNQLAFALSCGLNWDIYMFDIKLSMDESDNLKYINLTDSPNVDGALGLSWSIDGMKIYFVSNPAIDQPNNGDIYVLDVNNFLETKEPKVIQLTNEPEINNYYAFPVEGIKLPGT